jgi:hypothetical protein
MSDTITQARVRAYRANVIMLAQQKGSRLRDKVMVENQVGEQLFFERLAKTAAVRKTVRHGDTSLVNSQHSRRRVTMVDYEWADLIDRQDQVRMLISPQSKYAVNAAWAIGRSMDDEIIAGMTGTAYTGVDGTTTSAFPAAQKVAVAASGLTLAKLLSAKEILGTNDVDPDMPRYILHRPKDTTTLLNTTEVKSSDYNTVKALANGQMNTFLGFTFIESNRLITSTDAVSIAVVAWLSEAMGMMLGIDIESHIDVMPGKSHATQVACYGTFGSTRVEDEKVVEISVTA